MSRRGNLDAELPTLRVPQSLKTALERIADRETLPLSIVQRRALREYIDRYTRRRK
jgi:predicted transcriptional regulator